MADGVLAQTRQERAVQHAVGVLELVAIGRHQRDAHGAVGTEQLLRGTLEQLRQLGVKLLARLRQQRLHVCNLRQAAPALAH